MNSIRCSQCEHYIEANAGEGKVYGCDRSKCVFEQTTMNEYIELMERTLSAWVKEYPIEWIEKAYKDTVGSLQKVRIRDDKRASD